MILLLVVIIGLLVKIAFWPKSTHLVVEPTQQAVPKGTTQFFEPISPQEQIDNIFKVNG